MKIRAKQGTIKNLRVLGCGALIGITLTATAGHFVGQIIKRRNEAFKNQFSMPKFEESFKDTQEVEKYSFDYYGNKMTIQGDSVKIYTFDEDGNMQMEEGEKAEIPVENNDYLLDEYISEGEAIVYKRLKNKDNIKDQFNIYVVFNLMEKLYEEYLNRQPFSTLENRKEAIYKVCYDYVVSDKGYTIGGYKYSELPKTIQSDILEVFQNINYMRANGTVKEESKLDVFLDDTEKMIKYEIFKIGRK